MIKMSWWERWLKYWRAEDMKKPVVRIMKTQALKDEYREYYSHYSMGQELTRMDVFRMGQIEDELKNRKVYINNQGVDVYFTDN